MQIVVYRSTDFPIEEVASDLATHNVVVYAVPTRDEVPPLNAQLREELDSSGARGPAVVRGQVEVVGKGWFDYYTYGPVVGFDLVSAPGLIKEALEMWHEAEEPPRFVADL